MQKQQSIKQAHKVQFEEQLKANQSMNTKSNAVNEADGTSISISYGYSPERSRRNQVSASKYNQKMA
jgi:hypothetical protein